MRHKRRLVEVELLGLLHGFGVSILDVGSYLSLDHLSLGCLGHLGLELLQLVHQVGSALDGAKLDSTGGVVLAIDSLATLIEGRHSSPFICAGGTSAPTGRDYTVSSDGWEGWRAPASGSCAEIRHPDALYLMYQKRTFLQLELGVRPVVLGLTGTEPVTS